jgi:hypothetical protein
MNDVVLALASLPNGDLIAGGRFTAVGGATVNYIARLNTSTLLWSPLGSGVSGYVDCVLPLPNGDIVAAGSFDTAGGVTVNRIARWNGTTWSPLGSGVNGPVRSLGTLANGDIVASGDFVTAGGVTVNRIARWDGAAWSAFDLMVGGAFVSADNKPSAYWARWGLTQADSDADTIPDSCDACPGTVPGATVDANGCPPVIPGDFERDGDVDGADVSAFVACATRENVPGPPAGCSAAQFELVDQDDDADADVNDFAVVQRCYSGEGNAADPSCTN